MNCFTKVKWSYMCRANWRTVILRVFFSTWSTNFFYLSLRYASSDGLIDKHNESLFYDTFIKNKNLLHCINVHNFNSLRVGQQPIKIYLKMKIVIDSFQWYSSGISSSPCAAQYSQQWSGSAYRNYHVKDERQVSST